VGQIAAELGGAIAGEGPRHSSEEQTTRRPAKETDLSDRLCGSRPWEAVRRVAGVSVSFSHEAGVAETAVAAQVRKGP
jgi:hypothetical protein